MATVLQVDVSRMADSRKYWITIGLVGFYFAKEYENEPTMKDLHDFINRVGAKITKSFTAAMEMPDG